LSTKTARNRSDKSSPQPEYALDERQLTISAIVVKARNSTKSRYKFFYQSQMPAANFDDNPSALSMVFLPAGFCAADNSITHSKMLCSAWISLKTTT